MKNGKVWLVLWLGGLFFVGCIVVAIGLAFVGAQDAMPDPRGQWDPNAEPWEQCQIELPEGSSNVVFLRRAAHPFLAEFERKVRYEVDGHEVTTDLPTNTGGQTRINVYYYAAEDGQGPFIKLRDRYGNYYVDLASDVNELSPVPQSLSWVYIGRLDGEQGPLRFLGVEQEPEEFIKPNQ